ncbi:hypothetical protein [Inconstantimicrobium mannanitabidum]|uniref:Uncharacterized protein n=1 Tax=Inconstantimicrobium mannanitabidum TaxID=1604901 RepID=A0ACB5RCQ2_9CLOT|nr:hypothetical protein [Clostridium sp. TW13]GKX66876.1 hypothetical protein rsdtw13_21340 [Clostridium sp. TW13]
MNSSVGVNLNKELNQMSKRIKIRRPNHNCCENHEASAKCDPIDTIISCCENGKSTQKIMLFSLGAFILGYFIKSLNSHH